MKTLRPKKKGQKAISFHPGGLHESLGIPQGQPIPVQKLQEALAGKHGPLAEKQARFKENVLTGSGTGSGGGTKRKRKLISKPAFGKGE